MVGHRLYAVGGAASGRGALATLEVYDFRTRRWSAGPDLPLAREHLAAAAAGGHVYALAGRAAGQGNFARVDRYDPARRRWTRARDMAQAARRDRRGHGRRTGSRSSAARRARARSARSSSTTRRATAGGGCPGMRTPRHGLGGVSSGRRIYAIEGGDEPGFHFTRSLEYLDLLR